MVVAKEVLFLLLCHLLLHKTNSKCPKSYTCRNLTLEFPFTKAEDPECGLFVINGCDSSTQTRLRVHIGASTSAKYIVNQTSRNKFIILDFLLETLLESQNCYSFMNISLTQSPSVSFTVSPNITFFTCFNKSRNEQFEDRFQGYNRRDCEASTLYYRLPETRDDRALAIPQDCSVTQLPTKPHVNSTDLLQHLTSTFELEWNVSEACYECFHVGGRCLVNSENNFYCKTENNRLRLILAICIPGVAFLIILLAGYMFFLRKKNTGDNYSKKNQKHEKDIERFLKINGNLAPMRYIYSSIKKMTKSFSEELGKGGFGSVYKGKFLDGRLVAVEVFKDSNGNGEDFMNEVASISRTSHINIVTLLGYCIQGSKRALIYDFMPNGSLEKFIGNDAESVLGWEKLFEIALGIARGLEYLHQGCNTRILHLDIKPQNILLDKDMNPRISDFGLAKLCPNRSSVVSMLEARGTIGYVAPEVFSRNFGEVSYKSDVYSYGMLVLEMVGGRRDIDRRDVDRTSEIYFPHYIYKELEMDAERDGDLSEIMHDEGESQLVKRNLMIVGLWCVQTNPKDRPSMTKVVDMLEGKHGLLEVPPKPYLSSPPRPAPNFSTSESESL